MACKICALAGGIGKRVQGKVRSWILQLSALLILMNYVQLAIQSSLHLRLEAEQMAIFFGCPALIGVLYVVLDTCATLAGTGLIMWHRKEATGLSLLILHHTLHCMFFTNSIIQQALNEFVDVGSLLLLVALGQAKENKLNKRKLELLLLLSRICMSCIYFLWLREENNVVNMNSSIIVKYFYNSLIIGHQ